MASDCTRVYAKIILILFVITNSSAKSLPSETNQTTQIISNTTISADTISEPSTLLVTSTVDMDTYSPPATDKTIQTPSPSSSSTTTLTTTTTSSPTTITTTSSPTTAEVTRAVVPFNSPPECPEIEDNAAFLDSLIAPCRYDRLSRPLGGSSQNPSPTHVYVQIDIRHLEATEQLQFKLHMLLQYRYMDSRLKYDNLAPNRPRIVGEDILRNKIWVPHILLENERDSAIMGHDAKDIYMSIEPDGQITYSRRVKASLYCWMDLQKFPFDEQECDIRLLSWTYNASELMLVWEEEDPVVIANQLHLTEYTLLKHWTESGIKNASRHSRGAFTGNYSSLTFRFQMAREMGYYMLDYFIPSIMLVCTSWVSFWLQADAAPPRITIGTSTMLSFITLATAQTRTLPKVSYIKASEIWFLGCTIFIFGSLVEFAFVNIIWRRKSNVELKKVNTKYIMRSTLTPRLHRKELMKISGSGTLHKSHSMSSLDNNSTSSKIVPQYNNYLTVHGYSSGTSPPIITTESADDLLSTDKSCTPESVNLTIPDTSQRKNTESGNTFTTMTPQEISQWIDKRSRIVFPCAFIVFNAFYWGFVYWL